MNLTDATGVSVPLPAAPALDVARATRWRAAMVPWWVTRLLLPTGWFVAVLVAVAMDDLACTAADPGRCGPDLGFAWALVPLFATPVLLCWLPLGGCLTGVLFAGLDLSFDNVPAARVAFGVHGVLCAAVACWLVVARRRQSALVMGRPVRLDPQVAERLRTGLPGWGGRTLGAVVLILVGAAGAGWYRHSAAEVAGHVAAAVRLDATVLAVDEREPAVTVQLPPRAAPPLLNPVPVPPARVAVLSGAPYRAGQVVPVLADVTGGDEPWVRLVAEPDDVTGWLSAGIGALALAGVLLARERSMRSARRRLLRGPLPAVTASGRPDGAGSVLLYAGDGDHRVVLGVVPVVMLGTGPTTDGAYRDPQEWTPDEVDAFGRAWRSPPDDGGRTADRAWRQDTMTVVGDLRDGGWVTLITGTGVLVPEAPLRAQRPPGRAPADPVRPEPLPGGPLAAPYTGVLPQLPVTLRPWWRHRALGALLLLGFVAGPAVVLAGLPLDWWQVVVALSAGGAAGVTGWGRLTGRVTVTRTGLTLYGAARVRHVPWQRLHGVRRDGSRLFLAWEPDTVAPVGPFPGPDRDAAAGHWGAVMLRLRELSLAAGDPGDRPGSRSGGGTALAVAYAVIAAGVLWWGRQG